MASLSVAKCQTPVMTDGSDGPPLELRGLFEQFVLETR
jgi:hypothetical protein